MKPIDGSSRTYNTPVNREPICVAKRIRCASPPDKNLMLGLMLNTLDQHYLK